MNKYDREYLFGCCLLIGAFIESNIVLGVVAIVIMTGANLLSYRNK